MTPHCRTCECIHESCGYVIGSAGCDSQHDDSEGLPGLLATYAASSGVVEREQAYEELHDSLCRCGTPASALTCPLAVGLVGERCCRGCPDCHGERPDASGRTEVTS